jgi:hypothetical protein
MADKTPPQTGYGSKQIVYSAQQFASGLATSDYTNDGAIGVSSTNINPFIRPGVLQATATPTDASTNVAGTIIASCDDGTNVNGTGTRFFMDSAATFYLWGGSSMTVKQTGAKTYKSGISDIVFFNAKMYASSTADITMWDGTATSGSSHFDESFWTSTKSQSALVSGANNPHPLIVFEQYLWIGDANNLHQMDSSGTVVNSKLSLTPSESIVALGIDPVTGLMLISTVVVPDYTGSSATQAFVYLFDGYSPKPRRKIPVDAPVTAFYNIGGTVYVGMGQIVGYWNGNGVSFLRKLANVSLTNTDLPYKHHFSNIRNILLVVDGPNVLSFGETIPGQKAWFPLLTSPSGHITCIANIGSNKLSIASATPKFYTADISSSATGTGTLYFNATPFPRPLYIRAIRVITEGLTTTAGLGAVGFIDETVTVRSSAANKFVVPSSPGVQYVFDFLYGGQKVFLAQPFVTFDTQALGILSVIMYYDPTE